VNRRRRIPATTAMRAKRAPSPIQAVQQAEEPVSHTAGVGEAAGQMQLLLLGGRLGAKLGVQVGLALGAHDGLSLGA
jgi:hypothetical protein